VLGCKRGLEDVSPGSRGDGKALRQEPYNNRKVGKKGYFNSLTRGIVLRSLHSPTLRWGRRTKIPEKTATSSSSSEKHRSRGEIAREVEKLKKRPKEVRSKGGGNARGEVFLMLPSTGNRKSICRAASGAAPVQNTSKANRMFSGNGLVPQGATNPHEKG